MTSMTYFVVVPFHHDQDGILVPGEAKEAPNGEAARRRGSAMVGDKVVGAIAFSRTGDPDSGDFNDAVVLGEFGEVDKGALGQ